MDKISVIIPNFNNAATLGRCLDSILSQTYKNFEIIVVDDGSADDSHEVLREYLKKDPRFFFVQKRNGGVSSARNTGLRLATGDYIQFIDADDHIESNMFERLIDTFKATNADMVTFRFTHDCWKPFLPAGTYLLNDKKDGFKLYYDFFTFELPWNKMIKRAALNTFYNENIKIFEGSLYYLGNHKGIKKVAVIEDELYHYINSGAVDKASCVNGFLKSKFWENKTGYWYKLHELWPLFNHLLEAIFGNARDFMHTRAFDMAFIEFVKLIDSRVPHDVLAMEMHNIFNEPAFIDATAMFGYTVVNKDLASCRNYVEECDKNYDAVTAGKSDKELYYEYIALFFSHICGAKYEQLNFEKLFNKIRRS